jgi:cellulose synthase/poly-beta-1,6-N-acetylglucosamine synthase-like glycosyltransferase/peptidoglycan/xylan/chitin deacetylase (PgdA/CDA1 family)
MHLQHSVGMPIFSDPTGKRWRWILSTVTFLLVCMVVSVLWLTPRQYEPLWHASQNQAADYPQSVTESTKNMPVIGEGSLVSVRLVQHTGSKAYLMDPFTGEVLRPATATELKAIGHSNTVMERYGALPDKQMALTFDDGPSPEYTSALLDILAAHNVPATFFVTGENVLKHPGLLQRTVREGHMVGGHTLTHEQLSGQGNLRATDELAGAQRVLRSVAGYDTRLFRLPFGSEEVNAEAVLKAQQLGYLDISFTLDSHDWEHQPGNPIALPKLDGTGQVVILHDGGNQRDEMLRYVEQLIVLAKSQGYQFVTVEPLLPKEYVPKTTTPTLDDTVARYRLWVWLVGWDMLRTLNGWLMVAGMLLATVITVLYIVLALYKHYSRNRNTLWAMAELSPDPVSVVMPVMNEEKVIAGTLEALATSTHPEFEVVVVVNGSTDGTLEIAEQYAEKYEWLRVIESPAGKAIALNAGHDEAKYDIIVSIDADTKVVPSTLTMLARHFADPRVGGVAGHIKVGNLFSLFSLKGMLTRFQATEYLMGICLYKTAEGVAVAPGALSAWRKRILEEVGGIHSDTLAEDFDLTLRVRRAGWLVVQDNEAVAYTEAPETIRGLLGQRERWMRGTMQAMWKQRSMVMKARHGWLGLYLLPNVTVSILLSLVFLPLWLLSVVMGVMAHNWTGFVLFSLFAMAINFASTLAAIKMAKESLKHLLIIPVYWYIYAPLRTYVAYVSLIRCLKGGTNRWFQPARTNSVVVATNA